MTFKELEDELTSREAECRELTAQLDSCREMVVARDREIAGLKEERELSQTEATQWRNEIETKLEDRHRIAVHYETFYKQTRDELVAVNNAAENMARSADTDLALWKKAAQCFIPDSQRAEMTRCKVLETVKGGVISFWEDLAEHHAQEVATLKAQLAESQQSHERTIEGSNIESCRFDWLADKVLVLQGGDWFVQEFYEPILRGHNLREAVDGELREARETQ